jgi:hypothetical protein
MDIDTVAYFFAFQETKFCPINMAKPPVDRLSSRESAQSASKKALRSIDDDFVKLIPTFKVPCTYLRIRLTAVQCSVVAAWRN